RQRARDPSRHPRRPAGPRPGRRLCHRHNPRLRRLQRLTLSNRRRNMSERDPKELHEARSVESIELPEAQQLAPKAKRKKLCGMFAGGVALIGCGYSAMDALVWSKHAVTDNAYVGA